MEHKATKKIIHKNSRREIENSLRVNSNSWLLLVFLMPLLNSCNLEKSGSSVRQDAKKQETGGGTEVGLSDLIDIFDFDSKKSNQALKSVNYKEVETNQFLANCIRHQFVHDFKASEIRDSSILYLSICESHRSLEWSIDTLLENRIPIIVQQALDKGYKKVDVIEQGSSTIDTYLGTDELLLSVYNKGTNIHPVQENIMLAKPLRKK